MPRLRLDCQVHNRLSRRRASRRKASRASAAHSGQTSSLTRRSLSSSVTSNDDRRRETGGAAASRAAPPALRSALVRPEHLFQRRLDAPPRLRVLGLAFDLPSRGLFAPPRRRLCRHGLQTVAVHSPERLPSASQPPLLPSASGDASGNDMALTPAAFDGPQIGELRIREHAASGQEAQALGSLQ